VGDVIIVPGRSPGGPCDNLDDTIKTVFQTETSVMGVLDNLLFALTCGQSVPSTLAERRSYHADMVARFPGGYVFMSIIAPGSSMPNGETRSNSVVIMKEFSQHFLAYPMVMEGDGVWLSSMRMVARTMMITMPAEHPRKIFGTAVEAVGWAQQEVGPRATFSPTVFTAEFGSLRETLGW
jgi:hypothetical protein